MCHSLQTERKKFKQNDKHWRKEIKPHMSLKRFSHFILFFLNKLTCRKIFARQTIYIQKKTSFSFCGLFFSAASFEQKAMYFFSFLFTTHTHKVNINKRNFYFFISFFSLFTRYHGIIKNWRWKSKYELTVCVQDIVDLMCWRFVYWSGAHPYYSYWGFWVCHK